MPKTSDPVDSQPITDDAGEGNAGDLGDHGTDAVGAGADGGGTDAAAVEPADDQVTGGEASDDDGGLVQPGEGGDADQQAANAEAWRQHFERLGLTDFADRDDAEQRVFKALDQRTELLRQAQEQIAYLRSQQAQAGQPTVPAPSEPAAPAAPADPFEAVAEGWPQLDAQQLLQFVTTDESGNRAWKPDTPQEVRDQYHRLQQKTAEWGNVLSDPRRLSEAIDKRVERLLADRLESKLTERDTHTSERTRTEQLTAKNDWIWEKDPLTQKVQVGVDQYPLLSREGQKVEQWMGRFQQQGIQSTALQLELALDKVRLEQQMTRQAPENQRQQVQNQVADQRRKMMAQKNAPTAAPNANQTVVNGINNGDGGEATGERKMSLGERMVQMYREEGIEFS